MYLLAASVRSRLSRAGSWMVFRNLLFTFERYLFCSAYGHGGDVGGRTDVEASLDDDDCWQTKRGELIIRHLFFFIKMGHPVFWLFSSFQTNITTFTRNKCEKMSIQYMVLRFGPTTLETWVSSYNHKTRAPTPFIYQWIRLHLPFWSTWFKSQAQHIHFDFSNLNLNSNVKRTKINKKSPRLVHFKNQNWLKYLGKL